LLSKKQRIEQDLELRSNEITVVDDSDDDISSVSLVHATRPLSEKGPGDDLIEREDPIFVGAGYGFAAFDRGLLAPRHLFALHGRLAFDEWVVGVSGMVGVSRESFDAWSYSSQAYGFGAHAGYDLRLGAWTLSILSGIDAWFVDQRYQGGETRDGFAFAPFFGGELQIPIASWLALSVDVRWGVLFAKGAGAGADGLAAPWVYSGVGPTIKF
jgi:hypothetical protein